MDITKVVQALFGLIFAIITTFLIPWIKSHVSAEKLAECEKWVKIAVQAAEMIYTEAGAGADKKAYVISYLTERLEQRHIYIDLDDINNMIESAVLELNRAQY